jgi:5-methylcytosine-specific restriction endonuclease McrA
MSLMRRPVLQLNASYEALRIIPAMRALKLVTSGKALVELAADRIIYPGIYLPSVIRLLVYKRVPMRLQVTTRRSILMRDGYRCQYCGLRLHGSELTLDHVIPRAQGGSNRWENLVACCRKDNHRKADRTPEQAAMPLLRRPLPASVHTSRFILRSMGLEVNEWSRYLYADSDGDRRFAARG